MTTAPPTRRHASRLVWSVQLLAGLLLIAAGWGGSLTDTEPLARLWFPLVWGGWILLADAVVLARVGRSLLHSTPVQVGVLLAASAVFWWLFEAVNLHTRNWIYLGEESFSSAELIVYRTISFATVLPALAETRDLLRTFWRPSDPPPLRLGPPRRAAWVTVALGLLSGVLIWVFPEQAFALVWVAPMLVLEGVAALRGRPSALGLLAAGRAGPLLLIAVAALFTGFLWEMWNWGAAPHWEYRVPYVDFWRVFEMPLLGYLGYPPFALLADAFVRNLLPGRASLVDDPVTELRAPESTRN